MMSLLERWVKKYFSDQEGIILALLLLLGFMVVIFFGEMLAPVLASVVIAYLLDDLAAVMERYGIQRRWAVVSVFMLFISFMLLILFGLVPLLSQQIVQLFQELPAMIGKGQKLLMQVPQSYPQFITEEQIREVMVGIRADLAAKGEGLLSFSLASITTLFTGIVYLVLLPVLVFFS